ncbi:hypothetical protein [Parerythrobacter lacustris]|uniref:Uncharacterized protein n=1 Tax=Parerythrobacter lacustris TaxID=2969984 RepID=A0ABT1XPZ7_9SPHN|nr:hypothetical protein [Parerythrobacter lacustris]MCR2833324.1 hypothetical protein [Parerythrobacter lacustris]
MALQAIKARETEKFYSEMIEYEGEMIEAKVKAGERFTEADWAKWEGHDNRFHSSLYKWLDLGVGWFPGAREMIEEVDPRSLTIPDWGNLDSLLPGSNAVTKYKISVIKFRNWQRVRNQVRTAIYHAAFGGPNSGDLLQSIPGGGPTVERVLGDYDG